MDLDWIDPSTLSPALISINNINKDLFNLTLAWWLTFGSHSTVINHRRFKKAPEICPLIAHPSKRPSLSLRSLSWPAFTSLLDVASQYAPCQTSFGIGDRFVARSESRSAPTRTYKYDVDSLKEGSTQIGVHSFNQLLLHYDFTVQYFLPFSRLVSELIKIC